MEQVKQYLYTSFDFVSAISIPLMFGVAAVAPKFTRLFFGKGFDPVGPLMMIEAIVILVIAWSNVLGVQYLLPTGHNKEYTVSVTIGAVVNLVLNVPLIICLGANGAMISTVISEISVTAYQLYVTRKELRISLLFKDIWKYLVPGLIMALVVWQLGASMSTKIITVVVQVVIGGVIYIALAYLLNRQKIKSLIQFVLKKRAKG
jgi:O-antigen/teichoic acid export membrane protein